MFLKKKSKLNEDMIRLKMISQLKGFEEVFGVSVNMMMYEVESDGDKAMIILNRKDMNDYGM